MRGDRTGAGVRAYGPSLEMTSRAWRFALLCLLGGSAWMFDQAMPGVLTGLLRTAVHDGVLAVGFAIASLWAGKAPGRDLMVWLKIAVGADVMFAVPQILSTAAGGHVSQLTGVLVYLLVPVVVIFVVAQKSAGFGSSENPLRAMVPALAGLGGAALLLPFDWPPSVPGRLWLIAMIVSAMLAGAAAVWMHDLLQDTGVLRSAAMVCGACSLCLAIFVRVGWTEIQPWQWNAVAGEVLRCIVLDGPILHLTIWLLRDMEPTPFSARLLLIPLITIIEGYLLLRPPLSWTSAGGILLLAGGVAGLLLADSKEMLGGGVT